MSFDHFWLYTEKAAADGTDAGFTLYSGGHLIWLAAVTVLIVLIVRLYLGSSPGRRIGIRRLLALYLLVTEIVKDVIIVAVGAPLSAYLPLHLCGYAIVFLLIDAFFPWQQTTGQLIAYAFGPGALMALLFCSWTALPLFWNFMTIHSFLFHAVILAYMIMRLAAGEIIPDFKGLWISTGTVAALAVPAYIVDVLTGCNYMFIYEVQINSPLEPVWEIFGTRWGRPGYLAGAVLLVVVIFCVLWILYGVFRKRSARGSVRGSAR